MPAKHAPAEAGDRYPRLPLLSR